MTHVVYDLRAQGLVGAIDTRTPYTGYHSTACFSADGRRLYLSEGACIHVCEVRPAEAPCAQ